MLWLGMKKKNAETISAFIIRGRVPKSSFFTQQNHNTLYWKNIGPTG